MLDIHLEKVINNKNIAFHIATSEPKIYALQGVSGIGKTTCLNMIAGIQSPDKGYVKLAGKTVVDTVQQVDLAIRERQIGYLFQDYQLFPHMTIRQNITFMTPMNAHIEALTTALNITHILDAYPVRCSGGEKQRAALARALSMKPNLLLLDEPFSSLDDVSKQESMALVQQIFETWKVPIIFVTHSQQEAQQLAHEIIVIS
ncbi:molybdenum ABC transporter ATP-binding protein [Staphylococcus microti]|uniref:Molybdenum ABC transporter ATP-binding protein n=1 Tax=Staphylococcus microti TaxID=569857 RepID=A0A0D6XSA4_9STAP|nr:ATP-binding cassette domain-containing protein [Staphylococcus microti]KIX91116.1 molybdenum ABC transporter ATP-binding protein [Staphylococcus microti]PNZ79768.1 molybdenum ABC transporter ATP-binding protein [Staphylococcus microti]SUM58203.1 molybdenum import ATP-binding protein [Staphylococcus microti]